MPPPHHHPPSAFSLYFCLTALRLRLRAIYSYLLPLRRLRAIKCLGAPPRRIGRRAGGEYSSPRVGHDIDITWFDGGIPFACFTSVWALRGNAALKPNQCRITNTTRSITAKRAARSWFIHTPLYARRYTTTPSACYTLPVLSAAAALLPPHYLHLTTTHHSSLAARLNSGLSGSILRLLLYFSYDRLPTSFTPHRASHLLLPHLFWRHRHCSYGHSAAHSAAFSPTATLPRLLQHSRTIPTNSLPAGTSC